MSQELATASCRHAPLAPLCAAGLLQGPSLSPAFLPGLRRPASHRGPPETPVIVTMCEAWSVCFDQSVPKGKQSLYLFKKREKSICPTTHSNHWNSLGLFLKPTGDLSRERVAQGEGGRPVLGVKHPACRQLFRSSVTSRELSLWGAGKTRRCSDQLRRTSQLSAASSEKRKPGPSARGTKTLQHIREL